MVCGKDGKLTPKKVNYVEVLEDVDHDNYPVYDYDSGRVITVSRFAVKNEHTSVGITPHAGKYSGLGSPEVHDGGEASRMDHGQEPRDPTAPQRHTFLTI